MKRESELGTWIALAGLYVLVGILVTSSGCARATERETGGTSSALRLDGMLPHPVPAIAEGHGQGVARGGSRIAVIETPDGFNGFVHVYDAATEAYLYSVPGISADFAGDRLAIAGPFNGARIRDAAGAVVLTVPSPDPDIEGFGSAVALSGDRLVVAAAYDDLPGVDDAGRVFVFDATSGALLHTLASPAPQDGELFGWSLGLSGNLLAVGASHTEVVFWNDTGAVLLFDTDTGALLQTINSPSPNYGFGATIAVSGNLVAVGAAVATSAYVFSSTGTLLQAIPDPVPCAGQFACALSLCSLSLSGDTLAMGSCRDDAGAGSVGLYDAPSGALLSTIENPAPSPGDAFGSSVALHGNELLVGARTDDLDGVADGGSAWSFDVTRAGPVHVIESPAPSEYEFGRSVALDGDLLAVGHTEDFAPARVFLYDRATAELLREVTDPTPSSPADYFGFSVALSGDTLAVGAILDTSGGIAGGSVYLFDAATGALLHSIPNPAPEPDDYFGLSLALSGNVLAVGTYLDSPGGISGAGAVYLYDVGTGALLRTIPNPEPEVGDSFGVAVALDGDVLAVGSRFDDASAGAAWLFDVPTGTVLRKLSMPAPSFYFGYSIALSGDRLAVSSPLLDVVGLFDARTGELTRTLVNPDPLRAFGETLSMAGDRLAVGGGGAAYVYDAATGERLESFLSEEADFPDYFGTPVSLSGDHLAVGARDTAFSVGAVHLFALNRAPDSSDTSITTSEDLPVALALDAVDPDGDVLTWAVTAAPLNGAVTGTSPDLRYVPAANYSGSDAVTLQVTDGIHPPVAATVSITVLPVNDEPAANGLVVAASEDVATAITLAGTDPEGSALSYTLTSSPAKGSLSGTPPNLVYTPSANANGSDAFSFRVSDGSLGSDLAAVSISIAAVNDTPVAKNDLVMTLEDAPVSVDAAGNDADVDGDALNESAIVTAPANGIAAIVAGLIVYTPAANFHGTDAFTYAVSDGAASSNAMVLVTVVSVSDGEPGVPAIALPANGATVDTAIVTLLVTNTTDPDGDALGYWFEVDTDPSFASSDLQVSGLIPPDAATTSWTTAALPEDRNIHWRVRASDGSALGDWRTAQFFVSTANDAPEAPVAVGPDGSVLTGETPVLVVENAVDPEGDALTYEFEIRRNGALVQNATLVAEGAGGRTSFTATPLDVGAHYEWTARARDAAGAVSPDSAAATFSVHEDAPAKGGGCGCSLSAGEPPPRRAAWSVSLLFALVAFRRRLAANNWRT